MFEELKKKIPRFDDPEGRGKLFKIVYLISFIMLVLGYAILAYIVFVKK